MESINKVILQGNVGQNPKTQYFSHNNKVSYLSIATNEKIMHVSQQDYTKTQWYQVVCYNQLSDYVEQNIFKGSLVYIEGRINIRQEQKNNKNISIFEIEAKYIRLVKQSKEKTEDSNKENTQKNLNIQDFDLNLTINPNEELF